MFNFNKPKPKSGDCPVPVGFGGRYVEVTIETLEGEEMPKVEIEAHGFQGQGCQLATKGVEVALGKVKKRHVKRGGGERQKQRVGG